MMTLSGVHVGMDDGAPTIEDVALGLSRMPRFAGQTLFEWNVADHSVVCSRYIDTLLTVGMYVNPRDRSTVPLSLHTLLHDAHEALTGDIPTTFKTDCMREVQKKLDVRLYHSLYLPFATKTERDIIKVVDAALLLAEAQVCAPWATYQRILSDRNEECAMPLAVKTVEQYLHEDHDSREAFLNTYYSFGLVGV